MNRRTALKSMMLAPIGIAATPLIGSTATATPSIQEKPNFDNIFLANTPLQSIWHTRPNQYNGVAAAIFNPFNQTPIEFKIINSKICICLQGEDNSNLIIDCVNPTKTIYSIYHFQGPTIAIGNDEEIHKLITKYIPNLCDENGITTNSKDSYDLCIMINDESVDADKNTRLKNSFLKFVAGKNKQK